MKCNKCGYTIEEEQSFCNMCGAEQSKIKIKEKVEVRALLGLVKMASKNHRWMFYNFLIGIAILFYFFLVAAPETTNQILIGSVAAIVVLLLVHSVVQIFKGFKNPAATYTKRYKYALRLVWFGYVTSILYVLFEIQVDGGLIEVFKRLLY